MIAGVGIDSLPLARLRRALARSGDRFLRRVFTPAEQAYCRSRAHPEQSLAARFCAKEAVMKCLATGWAQGIGFAEIEVVRNDQGAVAVQLVGRAAELAHQRGIRRWHLSLTHTDDTASAIAIAEC